MAHFVMAYSKYDDVFARPQLLVGFDSRQGRRSYLSKHTLMNWLFNVNIHIRSTSEDSTMSN